VSYPYVEHHAPSAQRGVALITVMLVFALATMMATQMLRTSYLAIQRTGNLLDSTQARYYALGAEELGRQLLLQDLTALTGGESVDHLGEAWASERLSFDIEDGIIELRIVDQAGRFNLNSLVDAKGLRNAAAVDRFARLLGALGLDPQLAEVAADWIDSDQLTSRGGNELQAYGVSAMPNQPLADSSELRAAPGFDAASWALLAPEVSALAVDALLNVNTASAAVLGAYAAAGASAEVERFVHARKMQPLKSTQDSAAATLFAAVGDAIDVRSNFFMVTSHAEFRGRHVRLDSLLQRDDQSGTIMLLGRSDAARL
jgi:general secretion pathway protein K